MNLNKTVTRAGLLKPEEYNLEAMYKAMRELDEFRAAVNLAVHSEWDDKLDELRAIIYRHCSGPRAAKAKTLEKWVSLAVDENDVREVLQYVYSDGERIVGTNGHCMHIWKTTKYDPGYYKPGAKLEKVHDVDWKEYYNVDRLIDGYRGEGECAKDLVRVAGDKNGSACRPYDVYMYDEGQAAVNADYLEAVLQRFPSGEFTYKDKLSSIKFEEGDLLALVMPVRV